MEMCLQIHAGIQISNLIKTNFEIGMIMELFLNFLLVLLGDRGMQNDEIVVILRAGILHNRAKQNRNIRNILIIRSDDDRDIILCECRLNIRCGSRINEVRLLKLTALQRCILLEICILNSPHPFRKESSHPLLVDIIIL